MVSWRAPDLTCSLMNLMCHRSFARLGGAVSPGGGIDAYRNITVSVVPGTEILQLFYYESDSEVYSRWRNPDGSWSDEQNLGGSAFRDIAAVVVPGPEVLQLFYVAPGPRSVSSRWPNPDGSWSDEQDLGGATTSDITAALVP
jgi:hypothetical protein